MADVKQEIRNIRESNSNIQKDIDKIQHETAAMNRQNDRVQKDYATLSRDLLAVKGKSSIMVAFYATLRSNASFPCRRRIIMDDCLTNVGQAYNPRNGIFTAPVGGVYLFVATVLRCEGRGRASLQLCSDTFNSGYSQSHEGNERLGVNCTSHLTVKLSARQKVWLEAWSVTDLLSECTSFSGVLVQPDIRYHAESDGATRNVILFSVLSLLAQLVIAPLPPSLLPSLIYQKIKTHQPK